MGLTRKLTAAIAVACALVIAPSALGSGRAAATATPGHVKANKNVEIRVTGLKAGEKVKASEVIPSSGQKRTLYPKQRASSTGVVIVTVRAQVKGRHVWTVKGRSSGRTAKTHYVVT